MRNPKSLMPLTNSLSILGVKGGKKMRYQLCFNRNKYQQTSTSVSAFKNCFPMGWIITIVSGMSSITSNSFLWVGK